MEIYRQTVTTAFFVSILALGGCDTDPGKGKSQALVAEPGVAKEADETDATPKAETIHAFSAKDSKIEFVGAKVTRKHDGAFGSFTGDIKLVDGDPTKSSVTVDIDAASISSDDPKLTTHLKSPDFFDVEKFPKARFGSTSIRAGGEGDATHTIAGNLELHGVTKSVSFPAQIRTEGDRVEVDAEFAIDRKDFDLVYPGMPDDLIRDKVLIRLTTRASASPNPQAGAN